MGTDDVSVAPTSVAPLPHPRGGGPALRLVTFALRASGSSAPVSEQFFSSSGELTRPRGPGLWKLSRVSWAHWGPQKVSRWERTHREKAALGQPGHHTRRLRRSTLGSPRLFRKRVPLGREDTSCVSAGAPRWGRRGVGRGRRAWRSPAVSCRAGQQTSSAPRPARAVVLSHETEDPRGAALPRLLRAFQMSGGGREGGPSGKGFGESVSVFGPLPMKSPWLRNFSALPVASWGPPRPGLVHTAF